MVKIEGFGEEIASAILHRLPGDLCIALPVIMITPTLGSSARMLRRISKPCIPGIHITIRARWSF
jgi:hypothetical protein